MKPGLRLGIDIDGCLADFNAGYRKLFVEITGRDLFRGETDPPCWHYHSAYGYNDADMVAVWKAIGESQNFWETLKPYEGAEEFLRWLSWRAKDAEIYFITTRNGKDVKAQTEAWLNKHGFPRATVLIARGSKGALAAGLQLTHMLDDRPENLFDMPKGVGRYLKLARYNAWAKTGDNFIPITNLDQFIQAIAA